MDYFQEIKFKLEQFTKRYYLSAIIKGGLLFFGFGLLYAFFWIFVENFFWLSPVGRSVVFWSLILFEAFLLSKFLLIPLSSYLRIRKGINHQEASKIIGDFFPEIKDKLLNAIQLEDHPQSDFIIASIQQKTAEFKLISFHKAVRFKDNLKYLRFAVLPIFVLAVIYTSGGQSKFKDSFHRVLDHKTVYTPPPPFRFVLLNNNLQTIEKTPFFLEVKTMGDVVPDQVEIMFENQSYLLKKLNDNQFQYKFINPTKSIPFRLSSNNVQSETFNLEVLLPPKIIASSLNVSYPAYTKKTNQNISHLTDISVPEGTQLTWSLTTQDTERVIFSQDDSKFDFSQDGNQFYANKQVFSDINYSIETNNNKLKSYETLYFNVRVIKDQPPSIDVLHRSNEAIDEVLYFYGQLADDYGVSSLKLHYFPKGYSEQKKIKEIVFEKNLEFTYQFPDGLELLPDTTYELFFEVFDNDPFPKPKSSRSKTFNYLYKSENALKLEQLNTQKDVVQGLENAKESIKHQNSLVDELTKEQLQKSKLTFNDKEKIKEVLERQKEQDQILKQFAEQMQKTMEQFPDKLPDPQKENLAKRLNEQNQQLEKDEEKLKALEDLANKIQQEGLLEKLKQLAQQTKNKQKSIEQMLELTKRYYVSKKMEQIKNRLENLSAEQQKQTESLTKESSKAQKKINDSFNNLTEELEELREQNNALNSPLTLPETQKEEQSIKQNQEQAKELLEQDEQNNGQEKNGLKKAQNAQTKAAQKMMQLAKLMGQSMSAGSSQQLGEDIEMLRQILDNLLLFSFEQEALMYQNSSSQATRTPFTAHIKNQMNLKTHFEHVDDSLFVFSLRQPMISEDINKQISDVYFNIDNALSALSENRDNQAVAAQKYTITATNNLANMLSDILSNLEMQIQPNPGSGGGEMQLPDIILGQEELKKQAEQMNNGKEKSQESPGDNNPMINTQEGKSSSTGNSSTDGESSQSDQYTDPEESAASLFQLYKQQQELRQNLENILKEQGLLGQGTDVLKSMEELEQTIVNQGLSKETLQKMTALKHEFLKLEKAELKKGTSTKREAQTNIKTYKPQSGITKEDIKLLFGTEEILNRRPLPLRPSIKKKVQHYFNKKNDLF